MSTLNNFENPKVSVIVPVYQVLNYLERCINTIVNQTYPNLEIILVDDGSSDGSSELCDKLSEQDDRIIVIHQKNGGLSVARNTGLSVATGEFVTFVDSDDWVSLDIYEKCIKIFSEYPVDIVDFNVQFAKNTFVDKPNISDTNTRLVKKQDILFDYLYLGQTTKCPFSVCRKVYRKNLFDGISFPIGKINEDIVTNFRVLSGVSSLAHIDDIGYYYFQGNDDSITSGQLKKKDFDLLDASQDLCRLSLSCDDSRVYELAQAKLARSYFSLLARAAKFGISSDISKKDIAFLTLQLRKNYWKLLKSPMPVNRKILASLCCLDYRIIQKLLNVAKR